jgi:5'(3')-deoxyribonucleotidase
MAKRVIAVDIDDVLADSAAKFVAYSNKQWGTSLTVDDYSEHWAEMWGIDMDTTLKRKEDIVRDGIKVDLSHFPDAHQVLSELSKEYKLIIVTSRPLAIQEGTIEWLDKYYKGIFSDIHFAGIWDGKHHADHANKMTKGKIIKALGANFFIDDHPKHCFAVAKEGIPSLLFGDYAWNRELDLPKRATRVRDWAAIKEYFCEPG